MYLIYNLLSFIALICYLPVLLLRKGPEDRPVYVRERLGMSKYKKADIWVHAVSVGEVMAALPFLMTLKKEKPEANIVLSTITYTGQKIAREKFPEADRIMFMPWDTGISICRAVKRISPAVFITVETELWPVLFHTLKKYGSRIIILNGRISRESFSGYRKIRIFMKRVLALTDYLYMQEKIDAERIIAMGADEKKVGIMGNFKFDVELDEKEPVRWLENVTGQILLAGSTHKGEDEVILNAFENVKKSIPGLKLILAPRHPERFNEVEGILKKRQFNYIKRSEISVRSSQSLVNGQQPDIILLDTIGELSQVYAKVDIAFIGGSLLPFGGHNILEPAYWGKPVVFGPYMDNFPLSLNFLRENAAIMVKDSDDIAAAVKDLLENTGKAEQMGQKAKAIIEGNKGAVEKAMKLVRGFLGTA